MTSSTEIETQDQWWRDAVIYQVYVRSFADGDGDGTGDLEGVRSRLGYLRDLGVDALWFTPWYASPLADGGYDVEDYRRIDPRFGTLEQAERLVSEALAMGIRTIIDIVPNHISDAHPWFRAALAAGPGSPERERFWFHPGRGEDGSEIPTNWQSSFGGNTWSRTTDPDGTPGEWYLHLFSAEQPDLNWTHPDVVAEHEDVLRFWFDRGVAGVRIDSAVLISKDPTFPDKPEHPGPGEHPFEDRPDVHDVFRSWRRVADSYDPPRTLVGELWLPVPERMADYLGPQEMDTAFNFDFLSQPWRRKEMRASIEETLDIHAGVGAPATWVLSNHDVTRPVTRLGREDSSFSFSAKTFGVTSDLEAGYRRARAAALLVAALPGSLYIYQGDELGLPEHEDLPNELRQDPMYFRSEKTNPGRDGCRIPLPWSGTQAPFGFSPTSDVEPWLPQPAAFAHLTAEHQLTDPDSMLTLYRRSLALRRELPELSGQDLTWLEHDPHSLALVRGERFASITTFADHPAALPANATTILASSPLQDGVIPPDTTVWVHLAAPSEIA